jgi:hypothetical protein
MTFVPNLSVLCDIVSPHRVAFLSGFLGRPLPSFAGALHRCSAT